MKKLLIILAILLPTLSRAQTYQTYYYDSLGNEYHYDPTTIKIKTQSTKRSRKKTKDTTRIITTRRGVYILKPIK